MPNNQNKPDDLTVQDEPDKVPVELGAAVASGWIAPAHFPGRTTRGNYRTEWDGEPFPVTTRTQTLEQVTAQAWDNVAQLRALTDQLTERFAEDPMGPNDYNGHVASAPDPEVRRITSAVVKLEALGYRWDAERCQWIAPGGDEFDVDGNPTNDSDPDAGQYE